MKKILLFLVLSLTLLSSSLPLLSTPTSAATLSPDKYFLKSPGVGKSIDQELTIYGFVPNIEGNTVQQLYLYPVGMRKLGEEDDREFYIPTSTDTKEVANWITLSEAELSVAPGEKRVVKWKLTPTGQAICGTNLAAILVSTQPINKESLNVNNGVAVIRKVISQIHLDVETIDGKECDNNSKLGILEFKVNRDVHWFTSVDVPFLTRIKNSGNLISRSPKGFIEINGIGGKVNIPFNEEGLDIYPGTTRKFDNVWFDKDYPKDGNFFEQAWYELTHLRIGKYEAKLGVSKNVKPALVATDTFWVIPWRLLSLIILILVILIIFIVIKVRNNKKKNDEKIIRLRA